MRSVNNNTARLQAITRREPEKENVEEMYGVSIVEQGREYAKARVRVRGACVRACA